MMNPNDKKTTGDRAGQGRASAIDARRIRPGMRVLCSGDTRFAIVDQVHGPSSIKLERDENGVHHYIPISWVARVDDQIYLDRPRPQIMREWTTEPPAL